MEHNEGRSTFEETTPLGGKGIREESVCRNACESDLEFRRRNTSWRQLNIGGTGSASATLSAPTQVTHRRST